ncbi:hypothetical protein N780_09530 [Pontibacillus chungwhensis BH030062]|uniref:Uncharacterized protein n=1 Tax=Pontibacillus chungwhensis BH030062 TaxID=1385513 RepID=A0A0A2V857_9BACI|nr:hypothetical protein N780_09530 [Pontibacillus chungwhensis BH030062]
MSHSKRILLSIVLYLIPFILIVLFVPPGIVQSGLIGGIVFFTIMTVRFIDKNVSQKNQDLLWSNLTKGESPQYKLTHKS